MTSEERFWLVLDSSFDPAFVVDRTGTCLYANPACEALFGAGRGGLVGRSAGQDVHDEDVAGWNALLGGDTPGGKEGAAFACRVRHRDGSWHRIEGVARDLTGDPVVRGIFVVARDVTERNREAELQRALTVRFEIQRGMDRALLVEEPPAAMARVLDGLRSLTDSALAVALLWDTEAGVARVVAGRIDDAAPGYETTFPLSDFSPVSTFLEMPTIHVPDLATVRDPSPIIVRAREAGMRSLLTQAIIRHGEFFGVLTLLSGKLDAFDREHVALTRDVANQLAIALLQTRLQKELEAHAHLLEERVLERTAQLEAANRELETFSRSVSHDLRAPLQVIGGFSGLLREELCDAASPTVQSCLDHIRDGVRSMDAIISALLRLARVARQKLHSESVDLSRLAERLAEDLQKANPGRTVEFRAEPGLVAHGDHDLLSIVLANLLSNAWKYTRREAVARIELGATERDGVREYFVRDNGAGFDMEYAASLFEPFQRLHDKEEFEGTGLGLATVRQILERHGGDIRAEGAVDEGATFRFTLGEAPPG